MYSDSDDEVYIAPTIAEAVKEACSTLLPQKSRKKYEVVYKNFMNWRNLKNIHSYSENVLLAYFNELSEKYKSSSLWTHYSMLRSTLNTNNNINIEKFARLRAFLKRKSEGHQAKKAKTFTAEEIIKFINKAPDEIYLATKVALIMGIKGACRATEMQSMNIDDFEDFKSTVLVTIPNNKTKRKFTITGQFYQIYKKYCDLRPTNIATRSFFLNYHNGKCTAQRIGINKFGSLGKQIATYLKLSNPEMYTGHCFRRSSATLHVDDGGDIIALKRHDRTKATSVTQELTDDSVKETPDDKTGDSVKQTSSAIVEKCVDDSEKKKMDAAERLVDTMKQTMTEQLLLPCSTVNYNFENSKQFFLQYLPNWVQIVNIISHLKTRDYSALGCTWEVHFQDNYNRGPTVLLNDYLNRFLNGSKPLNVHNIAVSFNLASTWCVKYQLKTCDCHTQWVTTSDSNPSVVVNDDVTVKEEPNIDESGFEYVNC